MEQKGEAKQVRVWMARFDEHMRDAMILLWKHAKGEEVEASKVEAAVTRLKPYIPSEDGGDWVDEPVHTLPIILAPTSGEVQ